MPSSLYWPYDEVRVEESPEGLQIRAPWIEVRLERTAENSEELHRLIGALRAEAFDLAGAQLVADYFEPLDEHSLCYTLPTPLPEGLEGHYASETLVGLSFSDLLAIAIRTSQTLDEAEKNDLLLAAKTIAYDWSWDVDAALAFAAVGAQVHPLSLFSVARRYHLLSLIDNDSGAELFSELSRLPDDAFQRAARVLLRQNHYVTVKCQSALEPAVATAGRAREKVESFMREERGHDRILERALASVGVTPAEVTVNPVTRALMCSLEFAARHHFLAFAMAVDCFERRVYEDVEPLAKLLDDRGFSEAAKRLNQHKNINSSGEHHGVAREFLTEMAAVDPEYARQALRIAEAISFLMSQVVSSSGIDA